MRLAMIAPLWVLLLCAQSVGQCCLGAQDERFESPDGRYAVTAQSLEGTGFFVHGPYRYRFRWLELDASGEWRERSRFDQDYDSEAHYHMRGFVSPTGSGVLIDTPICDEVRFYAPDGTILTRYPRAGLLIDSLVAGSGGMLLQLLDPQPVPQDRGYVHLPRGQLLIPLGRVVDERLTAELLAWFEALARGEGAEQERLDGWRDNLESDEPRAREAAAAGLELEGMMDWALLGELAASGRPELALLAAGIADSLAGWQTSDAWLLGRDTGFLAALLGYPAGEVQEASRARLRAILPAEFDGTPAWIAAHEARLEWRDGRYIRRD